MLNDDTISKAIEYMESLEAKASDREFFAERYESAIEELRVAKEQLKIKNELLKDMDAKLQKANIEKEAAYKLVVEQHILLKKHRSELNAHRLAFKGKTTTIEPRHHVDDSTTSSPDIEHITETSNDTNEVFKNVVINFNTYA